MDKNVAKIKNWNKRVLENEIHEKDTIGKRNVNIAKAKPDSTRSKWMHND